MRRLQKFKESELIFTEDETKQILAKLFPSQAEGINSAHMTNDLRGFAQALLVEAIDASFKIGIVQSVWEATINPRAPIRKIIEKLITSLGPHVFHHATAKNIKNIKIAYVVVVKLRSNFGRVLSMKLLGIAQHKPLLVPDYTTIQTRRA